jgi:hypothetical protein
VILTDPEVGMTSDSFLTGALPVPPDISPPAPESSSDSGGKASDIKDSAKQQAAQVGSKATDAAGATVNTAKEQIGNVAQEAAGHAKNLWSQTSGDINDQATQQTQRLTTNIRQLAEHLTGMADSGESGTPAQSLVREAGQRAHGVADYLDGRQPGDFVTDLQQFGRRKPGTFLLGAAVAGFLAGRLVKAAKNAEPSPRPNAGSMDATRSMTSPEDTAIDLRGEAAALPPALPTTPAPPTTLTPALPTDPLSMPAGGDLR